MSHFDFVRPSGQWGNEMVPNQADYQRWDVNQSKFINGDLGGTYSPTSPIVIGGAGLQMANSSISGGVTTQTGGRIKTVGDYPKFGSGRSRHLYMPIMSVSSRINPSTSAHQLIDQVIQPVITTTSYGIALKNLTWPIAIDVPRRYLHQGATMVSCGVEFHLRQRPSVVPSPALKESIVVYNTGGSATGYGANSFLSWQASTSTVLNQYIVPSSQATNNGFYFQATSVSSDTHTGSVEPSWPSVVAGTVVDNHVTWTCAGRSGWLNTGGTSSVDTYYQNGATQTVWFDPQPAFGTVDNSGSILQIQMNNTDSYMVFTGVYLFYSGIPDMTFE